MHYPRSEETDNIFEVKVNVVLNSCLVETSVLLSDFGGKHVGYGFCLFLPTIGIKRHSAYVDEWSGLLILAQWTFV